MTKKINLPFQTDVQGATTYFKHLINGAAKARSERDALMAALGKWADTWDDNAYKAEVKKLINYLKSGDAAGGKPFPHID